MLQVPVKAGGITHLTDARFFAAYDVQYVGFSFDPQSPNYISPTDALAIKGWLIGPQIVAEFANQDIDNIRNILQFIKPDIIQLNANELQTNPHWINDFNLPVIVNGLPADSNLLQHENILFYLLHPGTESSLIPPLKCMYDYGVKVPESACTSAVHLHGSPEEMTGIKSYDEIADWLEMMSV